MNTAVIFDIVENISGLLGILVVSIFAWEVTLAVWLIVKGLNSPRITSQSAIKEGASDEVSERAA